MKHVLKTGHTVTVRALTDEEVDTARASAGPMPMWGQKVGERVERAIDELVAKYTTAAESIPELVRPDEDELRARAYSEVRAQMLEHDAEGWAAREAFNMWSINVLAASALAGLVAVEGWDMGGDVRTMVDALPGAQPVQFIAEVGTLVRQATEGSEGKGPAQLSPSTSPPSAAKANGGSAATAATTR